MMIVPRRKIEGKSFRNLGEDRRMVALQTCEVQALMSRAFQGLDGLAYLMRKHMDKRLEETEDPELRNQLTSSCWQVIGRINGLREQQASALGTLRDLLGYSDGREDL